MRPYDLAKSVFLRALELPVGERAAFVRAECAGDDALIRDVESLLAHHDETLAGLEAKFDEPAPASLGPWTIERELGRGGMGVVYLGHNADGERAAIKALRRGLLSPAMLARFRREAAVLARLDHPGIARLVETGVAEGPGGPLPWLAMEYVEGTDLRTWASASHTIEARFAIMADVADAVQHAHTHSVVHRDLKPENVLVRGDGRPVVLDFGVARLADADVRVTSVLTQVGLLVGTIRYMSPEQAEARVEGIGPASDVYTLGVLTYELLTGRMPYEIPEDSVHRALVAVMTATPRTMDELPAAHRAGVERVLRAALAKEPSRRLASAGALADDLRRVAAGRRPLARPVRERDGAFRAPWRIVLALASAAALAGAAFSAWRTPPTPLDWADGLMRPAHAFDRAMVCIDSAAVRLHYTTRTLAREREALVWASRARAYARTIRWRPYGSATERLALFRMGEAEYLIAERTNDVALYEAASKLWYDSREPRFPVAYPALPDSTALSANYLMLKPPPNTLVSSSMALSDAARLARPAELEARALARAREAERATEAILATTSKPLDDESQGWLADLGLYTHARLGVCLVAYGDELGSPDTLRAGIAHLRLALVPAPSSAQVPAAASHLHELGAGERRLAALERSKPLLDSAFVHLRRALEMRSMLEGYTSVYLSRLELAQTHRLAARLDSVPGAPARHLAAAEQLLALRPEELAQLGRIDRTRFAIVTQATAIDRVCASRDTSTLAAIDAQLVSIERTLDPGALPLLRLESNAQRMRVAAIRWRLTRDPRDERHALQLTDFAKLLLVHAGSPRWNRQLGSVYAGLDAPPPALSLDLPSPEPY